MNKIRFFSLSCLLLVFLAGCGAKDGGGETKAPANDGKPQAKIQLIPGQAGPLHFSYLEMQFQDVVAGDTVYAVYPFQNMSQGSVKIDEVKLSCYCLSAEYPKHNLAPGEVGEIKVTFATAGQARDVPATHEKQFPILVNGDMMPMETLRLQGRVLPNPNPPS